MEWERSCSLRKGELKERRDEVDKAADGRSGEVREHFPFRKQESLEKMVFVKDLEGWENFLWTEIRDGVRKEQWSGTENMRLF